MSLSELTSSRLREVLEYHPETGVFIYKISRGNNIKGSIAGTPHNRGYLRITIDGKPFYAHRLAFLYMNKKIPDGQVDHINTNKCDNRWENLRECNGSENRQNQVRAHKRNKTGLLGVSARKNLYRAQIKANGQYKTLGVFKTPHEAHAAYVSAKKQYHPFCTI